MNLARLTYRDGLMANVSLIPVAMMLAQNRQLIADDPTNPLGLGFLGIDDDLGYHHHSDAIVVESAADEDTEDPGRLVPAHGSGP